MDNEQHDHGNGFLIGLVVGGIVGAAAAYLATADKEERQKLLEKGKELLRDVEKFGENVKEKGADLVETAQEKVEEFPQTAKEAVKDVQEAAEEAIVKITQAADKAEISAHKQARKFFLQKGKSLVKK